MTGQNYARTLTSHDSSRQWFIDLQYDAITNRSIDNVIQYITDISFNAAVIWRATTYLRSIYNFYDNSPTVFSQALPWFTRIATHNDRIWTEEFFSRTAPAIERLYIYITEVTVTITLHTQCSSIRSNCHVTLVSWNFLFLLLVLSSTMAAVLLPLRAAAVVAVMVVVGYYSSSTVQNTF